MPGKTGGVDPEGRQHLWWQSARVDLPIYWAALGAVWPDEAAQRRLHICPRRPMCESEASYQGTGCSPGLGSNSPPGDHIASPPLTSARWLLCVLIWTCPMVALRSPALLAVEWDIASRSSSCATPRSRLRMAASASSSPHAMPRSRAASSTGQRGSMAQQCSKPKSGWRAPRCVMPCGRPRARQPVPRGPSHESCRVVWRGRLLTRERMSTVCGTR